MSDLFRDDVTAQELFDAVWTRFVVNGAPRSMNAGGCAYRGDDGAKCAVGILVTDNECAEWEGWGATSPVIRHSMPSRLHPHMSLLSDMQDAHDLADSTSGIESRLRSAAARHGLTVPS